MRLLRRAGGRALPAAFPISRLGYAPPYSNNHPVPPVTSPLIRSW
jgi:hypothetical protein